MQAMAFNSFGFLTLVFLCVLVYYLLPQANRRWALLVFSWVYYALAGPKLLIYLLFAVVTTFLGGKWAAKGTRAGVAVPLLLDFGMLAVLKYSAFAAGILNHLPGVSLPLPRLLLPLGISFYTFQSAGYLLDVYWKRCEPEKNFFHYALFVSFFPQLMQGPIGRFGRLGPQLAAGHVFDPENIRRGLWRISWGFFKKMVVADNAGLYVDRIFGAYGDIRALGIQGVLMYSVQLYADFSGGIDIALGIAQMLGITLDENFRQPYFAVSLTDFWHRWHITLGTWMKDYLFYPITLSGWMGALRRRCRKWFGKEIGRALPVCVANIIVFVVVGIWHGPAWHYIAYGLYNGLIIGISGLLAGTFRKWRKGLGITDKTGWFHLFCVARTFLIVNVSWFLDRSPDLGQALLMLKESFRGKMFSLTVIEPEDPAECLLRFAAILAGCLLILAVSLLRERGKDVRGMILGLPAAARILLFTALLMACALFGSTMQGGFIYANF